MFLRFLRFLRFLCFYWFFYLKWNDFGKYIYLFIGQVRVNDCLSNALQRIQMPFVWSNWLFLLSFVPTAAINNTTQFRLWWLILWELPKFRRQSPKHINFMQLSIHENSRGTEQPFLKYLLLYHQVCYISWLDAILGDLQTRPLSQILLFINLDPKQTTEDTVVKEESCIPDSQQLEANANLIDANGIHYNYWKQH